jgi:hypothetical protein
MTTKIVPRGGEGWYVYEVEQKYRSSIPSPRVSSSDGNSDSMGGTESGDANSENYGNDANNRNGGNYRSNR